MEILDPDRAIDLFFSSVPVAEDHARGISAECGRAGAARRCPAEA
jgi:hypothetical protein